MLKFYKKALLSVAISTCMNVSVATEIEPQQKYQPNWESLSAYNEIPSWFRDAKFGIYCHWGVYTVPAFGTEWYPHLMYFTGSPENEHQIKNYGALNQFEYHNFVPMFKAENFDAARWAELFKRSGAQFAGMVAEHHDGFAMWDSDVTPWNAKDKGPRRDVYGELAKEIKSRDMKLVATFHHARNLQRYNQYNNNGKFGENSWDSHFPYREGLATSSEDPELSYLYGNMPEKIWLDKIWYPKVEEVTRKYQPDMIYFDSWLDMIPESYRQKMVADILNKAVAWNKDVAIIRKQDDLPLSVAIDDLEKSRKNKIGEKPWLTDDTVSIGSWSYTQDLKIKPASDIIHILIDVVSKNGNLLLNVSPMSNGEIPENQQKVLLTIGDWLSHYGEAIYGTRPWHTYGEGPTSQPEGHFDNHEQFLKVKYTGKDVRYTTKGNDIYATFLGKPGHKITLKSVNNQTANVASISLLGSDAKLVWSIDNGGLTVSLPPSLPNNTAPVLKITLAQ